MATPRRLLGEPMVLDRHQTSWKVIVPLFILSGLSCTLLFSRVDGGVQSLASVTETQLPVTQQATRALQGCAVVAQMAAAMLAAPANANALVSGLVFAPESVNANALSAEGLVNATGEKHTAKFEKAGEHGQ